MLKLLMSWNIIDDRERAHMDHITNELVPLLMRHGVLSDVWLRIAGEVPQVLIGITAEDGLALRAFIAGEEWLAAERALREHISDLRIWFSEDIQPIGGFQS